jgi:UDP-N-acetylmuramate dehydrogenase
MEFRFGLPEIVRCGEPLAAYTYFGVGGPARWLAEPRDLDQLAILRRRCHEAGVGVRALGLGANLLVSDEGVDDLVLRLHSPNLRKVEWGEDCVTAGAGADMNRLCLDAARRGLSGLERMGGIPGTLGGIIRMNAGGRFGEVGELVRNVTVIDPDGRQRVLSRREVGFRYRGTNLGDAIICRATLELAPADPRRVRERYLEVWSAKKATQPLAESTAGCVFKNPPDARAGELIDRAGLKGRSIGGAEVSERHANFIVAKEGATAADILALIGRVRTEVARRFGVELELEIEVWGPPSAHDAMRVA